MAERTIYVFAKSDVAITRDSGGGQPVAGDLIGASLNGDAFSWQSPTDLSFTFSGSMTAITFEDTDGILRDDPFADSTVTDQFLTEPVTINGTTYEPSTGTVRWDNPQPVNVENEYEVTLFDDNGTVYHMVGISITQGYSTQVVGVAFNGATPPPGTTLHYIQTVSTYSATGQTMTVPEATVCFLAGTLIETPAGPLPIEGLKAGMEVLTLSGTARPIRWIGQSSVCGLGKLAPICIKSGVLGNTRDLYMSPNHRVLVRSSKAELSFGQCDVLVPAKAFVDGVNVVRVPMPKASYLHILLDEHDMVFSEGIATESLFSGSVAVGVLAADALAELEEIFPHFQHSQQRSSHLALTMSEARYLIESGSHGDVHSVELCAA
ncbi:Hint domain-containing protein [uncultured Sulfitobacter sp.]|uniref:Hint domain-containing protein n=1 Tax=uncultured Sulfitobacter sp. TaxID=191468 RepID=UPI0030DD8B6B|tara:strand:+ start:35979 stop:37112 length:1134 start_codon:yes stop_codon:yes gene_type:complete